MSYEKDLSWCGGFFDNLGSFSFVSGFPSVTIVNANPIASSFFLEVMLKNKIKFEVSEKSKPSKSSKKKRWDLFLNDKRSLKQFAKIIERYIFGKINQLYLARNFYIDDERYSSRKEKLDDYLYLMKYFNQTSNIIILDKSKLERKFGKLDLEPSVFKSKEDANIIADSFCNIDYVSGLLDSKGIFGIDKKEVKNSTKFKYTPFISLSSTNKKIVTNFCSTMSNLNIGYFIKVQDFNKGNRVRWNVSVSGIKRTLHLNNILKDKVKLKNKQSELMLKYASLRLDDLSYNDIGHSFKESIDALNKEN